VGEPVAHLIDLGPLALILQEDDRRFGVVEDVLDFGGAVGGVDARAHAADHHRRELADSPFRPVEAQHADDLTRLHAKRHQGAGGRARLAHVLLPCGGNPRRADLFIVTRRAWTDAPVLLEPVDDAVALAVCHWLNALRC